MHTRTCLEKEKEYIISNWLYEPAKENNKRRRDRRTDKYTKKEELMNKEPKPQLHLINYTYSQMFNLKFSFFIFAASERKGKKYKT